MAPVRTLQPFISATLAGTAVAAAGFQSVLSHGIPADRFDYAVIGGVLAGLWGGAAAALMPYGESSWTLQRALRVVGLGILAGGFVALYLFDSTATSARRLFLEAVGGFAAEHVFIVIRLFAKAKLGKFLSDDTAVTQPPPPPTPPPH